MTAHSTISRMTALALAGALLAGSGLPALADAVKAPSPPATPAEPSLTRDDARKHAADIFDRLDVNHDGVVNAADRKARHEAHLAAMFDRIDANHDGSITRAEFLAAHPGPHDGPDRHGPMRPAMDAPRDEAERMAFSPMAFALLRAADPQHTGSVTKDAFIAAELQRFDEADANHDGQVTHQELRAAARARREARGWHHDDPRGDGPHRPWGPRGDAPPPPPADPAK